METSPKLMTLALLKDSFDGKERQRAVSFWSIGSWGGSGLCALFGGLVASSLGWRWIFWMSIAVAAVSAFLLKDTPENKVTTADRPRFDWFGFLAFIIAMVALNIVIGQGDAAESHRDRPGARLRHRRGGVPQSRSRSC
jgi:MFS transporter, DHA2 family, multidrug resistance protein